MIKSIFFPVFVLVSFCSCNVLNSQVTKWTGAGGNDFWHNIANWTDSIPDLSKDALIDINNATIVVDLNAEAKSVTLNGTGTLFQILGTGTLVIYGSAGTGIQSNVKFENYGYIEITDTYHGILCQGTFENYGDIYVFDVNGDGIQNTGIFINQIAGTIDLENPIQDGFNNLGLLENYGLIETDLALYGIRNQDSLYNQGQMNIILGTRQHGIHNTGSIFTEGEIFVDSTNTLSGIRNDGLFKIGNQGQVLIQKSSVDCIRNLGTLYIEANGQLSTTRAFSSGYHGFVGGTFINYGSFVDSASLIGIDGNSAIFNYGHIVCSDARFVSIFSQGKFENFDSVSLSFSENHCILSSDTIHNHSTGVIVIDSNRLNAAITLSGGHFINDGIVEIQRTVNGITHAGSILNNGMLDIHGTYEHGMRVAGLLNNTSSGTIQISLTGTMGIWSTNIIENEGTIVISDSQNDGLLSLDSLINHGMITLNNNIDDGFRNFGYFLNESGANLMIMNTKFASTETDAFYNDPAGSVFNKGIINIQNSEFYGLKNQGIFNNYNQVIIYNTSSAGLFNRKTINNYVNGAIQLNAINAPNAIFNDPLRLIQNDGEISIDGASGIGVRNFGTINISSTGIISSQNVSGDFWINDFGAILNCVGVMDIK